MKKISLSLLVWVIPIVCIGSEVSAGQSVPLEYGPASGGFEVGIYLNQGSPSPTASHKVVLIGVSLKNVGKNPIAVGDPLTGVVPTVLDAAGAPVPLAEHCPMKTVSVSITPDPSPQETLAPGASITDTFDLGCKAAFKSGEKYTLSTLVYVNDALYTKNIAVLQSNTITFTVP